MVKTRIGVDLMGSDTAPEEFLAALEQAKLSSVVVFGQSARKTSLEHVRTSSFIAMEDAPLSALRKKRDASVCVGLRALERGEIDAFISAGNTGALVSASKMILGTLRGILRPALLAHLPTKRGKMSMLDVGANVKVSPTHLVQFAKLGIAEARARGVRNPKLGLLNIGSEAGKGTAELQKAYRAMKNLPAFVGNIEGTSAFQGAVDVLVTDGFAGNVFLKAAEGVASLVASERVPPHSPGALLAGLEQLVFKCHGYATPATIVATVRHAAELVEAGFMKTFQQELARQSSAPLSSG